MKNFNLVLSGGGARGFAHIGVIKALQEKGASFSAISATSSGAIIAALLCDGYNIDDVTEICREAIPLTKLNFPFTHGILSIESLEKIFSKYLVSKTFDKLKIPLFVSATDLNTGKQAIIREGNITEAVKAGASIPIVFEPVYINGVPYIDGGVSGNLPVEPFIGNNLKTIGVHVNKLVPYNTSISTLKQVERIIHLSIRENVLREIEKIDVLIEPEGLERYSLFETRKMDEIIKIGYDFTMSDIHI